MKFIKMVLLTFFFSVLINILYYQDYSGKVLKYWIEPTELNYYNKQERDYRYRVSVIETTRATGFFTSGEYHYQIFISKQSVKPELDMMYGHYKEYGLEGTREEVKQILEKCDVHWEVSGVWFVDNTGHKLFFPKSTFMGGR